MTMIQDGSAGMGDLIPLKQVGEVYWVDARLLHVALGSGTRFSDWITRRLGDTLAAEGEDFYSELSKTSEGGRPATQYHLSVDLAKEIAMLERTDRGKAIRRYFIQAERNLREGLRELPVLAPPPPLTPAQQALKAAEALVDLELRTLALEAQADTLQRRLDNTPIMQFPEQEGTVRLLCQELGQVMPGGYPAAYRAFKSHFGHAGVPLARYSSLPTHRFDEACGYLRGLIAQHSRGRLLDTGSAANA